jgi:ATP-dependent Clp protease ATP-binding subunit ClpX
VHILTRPKTATVKQFAQLLAMDGVDLTFTDTALAEIVRIAHKRGTGAPGLGAIPDRQNSM